MVDINLNMEDTAEVPVPTVVVVNDGDGFKDKSPCNWNITQLEDGSIYATSSNTLETFSGTMEEFNAKMKG
jgi:hypothetical protein